MKPEWKEWASQAKAEFPRANSALMPLMHRIQLAEGWLSDQTIHDIADLMGVTVQYVESVASFYSLFHREPVGKRVIHVCVGLSCALAGSDELMHKLEQRLDIKEGQTTADGEYTLLEAECLAACDKAPMTQVDLHFVGPVRPEEAEILLTKEVSS